MSTAALISLAAACGGAESSHGDGDRSATLDDSALRSAQAQGGEAARASGPWDCKATIDADEAQRAVARTQERLAQCYQQVTDGTNPPEGRLVVHARVGPDGHVTDIVSGGSLQQPRVTGCMVRVVADWTFEHLSEHTCAVVTVPFRFGRKRTYWLQGG